MCCMWSVTLGGPTSRFFRCTMMKPMCGVVELHPLLLQ